MSTIVLLVLTVTLLLLALGWVLYAVALRVDRLHRQVLGSRATLEAQLVHRGQAAIDFAATGALDPASAVLLSRAAHDALDCDGPVVEDGLDPDAADSSGQRSRALVESDLSRVLRAVLNVQARAALTARPLAVDALARLDKACYRLVLARRFHNARVAEARRLRSSVLVRCLHLAGHAPMPQTFDIDDDAAPVAEPVTGAAEDPTNGGSA